MKRTRNEQNRSAVDEKSPSNKELVNVQGMPSSVDVPGAAGQQILPDGTIRIQPSSIQPGNTPSSRGLDANSQWRKRKMRSNVFVLSDSANVGS